MSLVEFKNVSKSWNKNVALDKVSFTLKEGELAVIIGPNGAGKTTLTKLLIGSLSPDEGVINKKDNLNIGYLPQNINIEKLIPINVESFLKYLQKEKYPQEIFSLINIQDLYDKQLYELSGGELQRVMLAASIINHPELLILDEPVQALDIKAQIEFYKIIDQIRKTYKISILMISHDLYTVMRQADKVICLNKHICCIGNVEEISKNKNYRDLFGQEASKYLSVYGHIHDHNH